MYKLADFGVAQMLDEESKQLLRSTEGTYHFLAPECTTGDEYDPFQVDIWALGVTLYAMLQGTLPFGTKAASLTQVMDSIREDPLVFESSVEPDCAAFMRLMLEKDPSKRIRIQELKHHPWILTDMEEARFGRSNSVIVEVSQQEIEAAFTPVNNFILMTKLKLKMSSRLARARKSVQLRHEVDVVDVQNHAVARMLVDRAATAGAEPSTVRDSSGSRSPLPELMAESVEQQDESVTPLSSQATHSRGEITRRRSVMRARSGLGELDELLQATSTLGSSGHAEDREHERGTAETALPHVDAGGSQLFAPTSTAPKEMLFTNAPHAPPEHVTSSSPTHSHRRPSETSHAGALPAIEPRLPPLELSWTPSSSPAQSPTTSPKNRERANVMDTLDTSPARCQSPHRTMPERRRSSNTEDHHLQDSLPLELLSDSASSSPSRTSPTTESAARLRFDGRHRPAPLTSPPDTASSSYEFLTSPTPEPPVMLTHRKSGSLSPSTSSGGEAYVQSLASAKKKGALAQRVHSSSSERDVHHSSGASGDDHSPSKAESTKHKESDAPRVNAAVPVLPNPISPSRTASRATVIDLGTTCEDFGDGVSESEIQQGVRRTSIEKMLDKCLLSDGRTADLEPMQLDAAKSAKVFEKRNSNITTVSDLNDTSNTFSKAITGHDSSSSSDASKSPPRRHGHLTPVSDLNRHCSSSMFQHLADEMSSDTTTPDRMRRSTFVRVFTSRRSLADAQDSLQRKNSTNFPTKDSRGSEAYESRNYDHSTPNATGATSAHANTAALSALPHTTAPAHDTSSMSKRLSTRKGSAFARSTSHVADETPKTPRLLRSQKTAVCSIM